MIFIRLFFILCLIGILIAKYVTPELGLSALLISYYVLGASFYAVNIPVRSAFVKELFGNEAYARVNSILEIENQVAAVVTGLAAILVLDRFGLDRPSVGEYCMLGSGGTVHGGDRTMV